jgi:hypothetical protein
VKRDISLIRLSRDHHRGLSLAQHLDREAPAADAPRLSHLRREALDFWASGLLPHFRAECECLLARLVRHVESEDELVGRTQRDHVAIHAIMASLRVNGGPEATRPLLLALAKLLREHIRWEEAVLFEATQRYLRSDEMASLGEEIADRIPEIPPPPAWYQ